MEFGTAEKEGLCRAWMSWRSRKMWNTPMDLARLTTCHAEIASFVGARGEPLTTIQRVEEHRWFWRPQKPRLILLAESHVHTSEADLVCAVRPRTEFPAGLPTGFVRLVYCLGYGESSLIDGMVTGRNTGTPQFWQIFHSCIHRVISNSDFRNVQISRTRGLDERVNSKLRLLHALREEGIWLVDASIAALYQQGQPKPSHQLRVQVIQTSWDRYVGPAVVDAAPEAILCIGVGVARTLKSRLNELGIPWGCVPQPQARLSPSQRFQVFATYHAVSRDPSSVRKVSREWLVRE